jgi:hypothetical protein
MIVSKYFVGGGLWRLLNINLFITSARPLKSICSLLKKNKITQNKCIMGGVKLKKEAFLPRVVMSITFPHNTMFGSSVYPVVCMRARVLYTVFVFAFK